MESSRKTDLLAVPKIRSTRSFSRDIRKVLLSHAFRERAARTSKKLADLCLEKFGRWGDEGRTALLALAGKQDKTLLEILAGKERLQYSTYPHEAPQVYRVWSTSTPKVYDWVSDDPVFNRLCAHLVTLENRHNRIKPLPKGKWAFVEGDEVLLVDSSSTIVRLPLAKLQTTRR